VRSLSHALVVAAGAWLASPAGADTFSHLDFETPGLGLSLRAIHDPYTGPGVVFDVVPDIASDAVVGLVKNHATSACVNPPDLNQKLGTGRLAYGPDGDIGQSGYPIRARFDPPLNAGAGEVFVEVQFQVLRSTSVIVTLLDDSGQVIGGNERIADSAGSTCGNPGNLRSRVTLRATTLGPVRFVRMETSPSNRVFVVDDFSFGSVTTAIEPATWSRIKNFYLP